MLCAIGAGRLMCKIRGVCIATLLRENRQENKKSESPESNPSRKRPATTSAVFGYEAATAYHRLWCDAVSLPFGGHSSNNQCSAQDRWNCDHAESLLP